MKSLFVISAVFSMSIVTQAQGQQLKIQAIDGKSGKALAGGRLVVFTAETADAVRTGKSFSLHTDQQGSAEIGMSTVNGFMQVFVDKHVLCQDVPSLRGYGISRIVSDGVSSPNDCGSVAIKPRPGVFVVYARHAGFWDRMKW